MRILDNDTCFVAGTPVLTPDGEKPIEMLKIGDVLIARPEDNADTFNRVRHVEQVFKLEAPVIELHVGGRILETTPKHPFYVPTRGWVNAIKLEPGDQILGHDNRVTAVEQIVPTERLAEVYNVRVEDDHTYFVGGREWGFSLWVHNDYVVEESKKFPGKFQITNTETGNAVRDGLPQKKAHLQANRFQKVYLLANKNQEMTDLILDSNEHFLLTVNNATEALIGPRGTTPRVKGQGGEHADVIFTDNSGKVVFAREVKSITSNSMRTIDRTFSDAADQIRSEGGVGEIFFQMQDSITPEIAETIVKRLAGQRANYKAEYSTITFAIFNANGDVLFRGPLFP